MGCFVVSDVDLRVSPMSIFDVFDVGSMPSMSSMPPMSSMSSCVAEECAEEAHQKPAYLYSAMFMFDA